MNLPKQTGIVIIGAGIQGLLLAAFLHELGRRDVLVLDAGYWEGGASGRNGTLVRGGFSSPEWAGLFQHSIDQWKTLSRRLGHNVMYTPRGYAIIAESEQSVDMLRTASKTHQSFSIPSTLMTPDALSKKIPALDANRISAAIYLDDGGTVPHHAVMKAALRACQDKAVPVHYGAAVTAVERTDGRVSGVWVGDHHVKAELTVVAAGGQSGDIAQMASVEIEASPFRIEACASEPVRPLIQQAIALVDRMTYLHQTARGEIVGGTELRGETAKRNLKSSEYVIPRYARNVVEIFPQTHDLRILRQWAGYLHPAPDGGPLLGPHPDVESLWFTAGWTYGIAGGPGAADLLSRAIVSGVTDTRMACFSVDRFRRGKPCIEASAVIDSASSAA